MKIRLGDYIQEYSVKNKDDENIPVYSVTNTKGFCKDYFGKEVASKDKTTYKIVPYGYFAYNPSRINVGSVDWQRKEKKVIVSPLYNVFSVSPDLERQYLYYYLKSDFVLQRIKAVATGSVRDNLRPSMLYEFPIELSELENQRKIVKILDKVSDVIEKKEQELEQLDTLVKSRFVEMFGNPRTNSKGFQTKKGSELFKISNGKAVPNNNRFKNGIPAYGGNGISWYTDNVLYEYDTIVIGRVGFQSGNVHLVKGPVWVTDNAMYISDFLDDSLSLFFLCEMMEQIDFTKHQDAGDLKKVTQKPFMDMNYIVPPKKLQNQFADFVASIDKSKSKIQKSLEETQLLFDSLMQKYFG